ncbi:MAG: branched-chain amino acid ABC transporter permease [Peptococcaceae bacterium]|nr:branched-chain amino acid ABC transporter permease [Peptococcaceae bacterium]
MVITSPALDQPDTKKKVYQYRWYAIAAVILGMLTLPLWASQYVVLVFLLVFLYMAIAQMWNLLAGYAGLVSLGTQIFIGLGGYTLAVATEYYGFPIWSGVLLGGVVSVVFALIISVPIFRMKGEYFTIATWIVAEALLIFFSNWAYVRQGMGFFIRAAYKLTTYDLYYAALFIGVGAVALVYIILRTRLGLGLMAMRDEEEAAETMGVETFRSKLYCFLISAFVVGITGGVFYLSQVFIQPYAAFGINWTIAVVFIVIIGGIGTVEGPIIGAIIYVILQQFLSEYVGVSLLILGAIAITVILVASSGIMGMIQKKVGFAILSPRRE